MRNKANVTVITHKKALSQPLESMQLNFENQTLTEKRIKTVISTKQHMMEAKSCVGTIKKTTIIYMLI